MIQVYADGVLAYDSRFEQYDLIGLEATNGLNIGGTAEIVMPLGHPAYSLFIGHRTIVTIYRDGKLRFRGRALYTADDHYRQRTVTCEGEMCFLRDAINRSYNYKGTPAQVFRSLVRTYNSQVDAFKQFTIGTASSEFEKVANAATFKSDKPETILDTFNKLLDLAGGYIVFSDGSDGTRAINYLSAVGRQSEQSIEFGENLLEFTSSEARTTDLATGLIPYGAKDEETKQRLTIADVNNGKDYIIAEDAVALRGTIMTSEIWDDVTDPAVLLEKAWAFLNDRKVFITSLELTALDLSYIDKEIDTFAVGDQIRVVSPPHGVDELFQLSKMTEDFIDPSRTRISLGKDLQSLTGSVRASDYNNRNSLESATWELKGDYEADFKRLEDSVDEKVAASVSGSLSEAELRILKEISEGYAAKSDLAQEVALRGSMIKKLDEHIYVGGGSQKTYVHGSEVHIGHENFPTFISALNHIEFLASAYFPNTTADFGNGRGVRIYSKAAGVPYYVLRVDASDNCFVGNDYSNLYLRGPAVYLHKSNSVVTSDKREKNSIEELPDAYVEMLDRLTPVRFKYNDGQSGRFHVGFIAQDVEKALAAAGLTTKDFGGFVDLDGDGKTLGLAYDEFVGLLFQKIRKMEKRITELERSSES